MQANFSLPVTIALLGLMIIIGDYAQPPLRFGPVRLCVKGEFDRL
jgi:hypothetical protein